MLGNVPVFSLCVKTSVFVHELFGGNPGVESQSEGISVTTPHLCAMRIWACGVYKGFLILCLEPL